MTEREQPSNGRVEPPRKIYRTCTIEGLGSRKEEFLRKIVEAMKERGLEELPPVEPFEHHLGLKDALKLWDTTLYEILGRQQMVGTDVLLGYDRKESHLRMGLRAEVQGKNLRFGYFHTGETISPLRSPKGTRFVLWLVAFIVFVFAWGSCVALSMLTTNFFETYGLTAFVSVFVTLCFLPIIPLLYIVRRRETRPRKEIDQLVLEISMSMGGKQITPFRKTTVNLED